MSRALQQLMPETTASIELIISEVLHDLGMSASLRGFSYCREAIRLAMSDRSYVVGVTKILYPEIAKTFQATPSRVERNIRHSIEALWDRGDNIEVLELYFSNTVNQEKGRPTNSEFITMIADWIQLRM